jgi:predicted N-acetyltransferase YhbS
MLPENPVAVGSAMQIDYLADHPDLAATLAEWHYGEWRTLLPGWSLAQALADLRSHTGRRQIPTTLVAVADGRPLGSASLLAADLPGWEHLTPWVASVYVRTECRGLGIGSRLVTRAVEEAGALGVPVVYLFTAGQRAFYERLGWVARDRVPHHGSEVLIMTRWTTD